MSPTKTELVTTTGAVKTPRKKKVPGLSAALAGIERIEGNGEIAILRYLLRVQSGGPLLHRTEWTADGNGGQFAHCILRCVQIRRQRDAVAIVKGHFFVVNLVAFGEHLVPFLC